MDKVEQDITQAQNTVADAEKVVAETEQLARVVAPIGERIIADIEQAVHFVIHCFGCRNTAGTSTPLVKDSVTVEKKRNSMQISGTCAKCGSRVKGFVSPAVAASAQAKLVHTGSTSDPAPENEKVAAEAKVAVQEQPK